MHPGRGWADTPSSIAATIPTGQAETQGQEVRAQTLVPRGKGLRRRRHREKRRGCPLPLTTSLPVVSLLCPYTSDLPSFLLTSPPCTVFGHRSPPLFRREKTESTAAVVCVCVCFCLNTLAVSGHHGGNWSSSHAKEGARMARQVFQDVLERRGEKREATFP